MFKKLFTKLIGMENPFSSEKSGDPRTDLKTRGPAKVESAEEKFKREQEEARFNLEQQQQKPKERDLTEELRNLEEQK